jgi:uncharacterized protein (DUF2384 family)
MKKVIKSKNISSTQGEEPSFVSEPLMEYIIQKPAVLKERYMATELAYKDFKTILDLNVFTIAEWASLLQLSERTFHRYAKDNLSFNAILTERIALLQTLINEGLRMFGTQFKSWLNSEPYSLFGKKPIQILYTQEGILEVYRIMKRMQHGIVA